MRKIINLIVQSEGNNLRLDVFISKKETLLSRTRIKNLILNGRLKLNNKIFYSPSYKLSVGDKIHLEIPNPKKTSLKPYNFKLEIIFEDEDLMVINKLVVLYILLCHFYVLLYLVEQNPFCFQPPFSLPY